jgi:hypothetical protein
LPIKVADLENLGVYKESLTVEKNTPSTMRFNISSKFSKATKCEIS